MPVHPDAGFRTGIFVLAVFQPCNRKSTRSHQLHCPLPCILKDRRRLLYVWLSSWSGQLEYKEHEDINVLLSLTCLLVFPVVLMLSWWGKKKMQFTPKGSVNFVPSNIVIFIWRLTCICTLYLNALPRKRDAEGFCNTGCRPCQQGVEGAWLILKVRCE